MPWLGDGSARVNISVYVYNNNFCNVCCLHAADAFSGRTPAPAAADWCESVVYFMPNRIERERQKAPTKKRPHVNYKRSWLPTIKNRIKRNLLLIFYAVRSFVILLCTSFAMLRILRFILFFFSFALQSSLSVSSFMNGFFLLLGSAVVAGLTTVKRTDEIPMRTSPRQSARFSCIFFVQLIRGRISLDKFIF